VPFSIFFKSSTVATGGGGGAGGATAGAAASTAGGGGTGLDSAVRTPARFALGSGGGGTLSRPFTAAGPTTIAGPFLPPLSMSAALPATLSTFFKIAVIPSLTFFPAAPPTLPPAAAAACSVNA